MFVNIINICYLCLARGKLLLSLEPLLLQFLLVAFIFLLFDRASGQKFLTHTSTHITVDVYMCSYSTYNLCTCSLLIVISHGQHYLFLMLTCVHHINKTTSGSLLYVELNKPKNKYIFQLYYIQIIPRFTYLLPNHSDC